MARGPRHDHQRIGGGAELDYFTYLSSVSTFEGPAQLKKRDLKKKLIILLSNGSKHFAEPCLSKRSDKKAAQLWEAPKKILDAPKSLAGA